MIQAAFFDIDGTLVSFETHEIPASTVRALSRLHARGIKLIIATGRSSARFPQPVLDLIEQVPFDAFLTFNGQYCYDAAGTVVRDRPLDEDDARHIIDLAAQGRFDITVMQRERSFVSGHSRRVVEAANHIGGYTPEDNLARAFDEPIYQLCVFVDPGDEQLFLEGCRHVEHTRWCEWFCDVIPAGGGKPAGIRALLERYDIAPEDCIAFGDGGNDIPMLRAVGVGVALGNAGDAVKAAADYVTSSVDDDGVWHACEHYGLL